MSNVSRRIRALERLPQFQLRPSALEQITSLALQSLSEQDLHLLRTLLQEQSGGGQPRELSAGEGAAWASCAAALQREARRMGFRCFAQARRNRGTPTLESTGKAAAAAFKTIKVSARILSENYH